MGLCEGCTFPAITSMMARWAPLKERSFMTTLIMAGSQVREAYLLWTFPQNSAFTANFCKLMYKKKKSVFFSYHILVLCSVVNNLFSYVCGQSVNPSFCSNKYLKWINTLYTNRRIILVFYIIVHI